MNGCRTNSSRIQLAREIKVIRKFIKITLERAILYVVKNKSNVRELY